MAKYNPTSSDNLRRFDKELSEDINDFHLDESTWTQARNAINNSKTGDLGKLGNEPGNQYCTEATYTIIGAIHTEADIWVLYSTDETNSEIGLFKEGTCTYLPIVNDPCLNFSKYHLIKGVSRSTSDCYWKVYWDDGNNPSRVLTVDTINFNNNLYSSPNSPIPWIQDCIDENGNAPGNPLYPEGCITCTNTSALDCDAIRLAKLVTTPCVRVEKGVSGGTLANGSYFAVIAYCIDGQKLTDYFKPSNLQPLFDHDNVAGSLDIYIDNADLDYDSYELVVVSIINSQTVAKKIGIYNITQTKVTLDTIDPTLTDIPLNLIPLETTVYEKTEAMFKVNNYLIRTAPTTKFDFNYQPLANQIVVKWQAVEYDKDYYKNGGSNTGYMRDEVYPFFIRWIYNTGDKSASYHIPGRPALTVGGFNENAFITVATDALPDEVTGGFNYNWVVNNLAQVDPGFTPFTLPDGGNVIAEGLMGYWESTEFYPNDKPEVWNASAHPWSTVTSLPYSGTTFTDYDLCGEPIRHHRFPDNFTDASPSTLTNHFNQSGTRIRIMGVSFDNIKAPVDNNGNPIPNIVGYEILRGTRNANKTVVAKGIINNMRLYDLDDDFDPATAYVGPKGAYQNYPYNDLRPDPFLSNVQTGFNVAETPSIPFLQSSFSRELFSFHSPETTFYKPFLSSRELKVYSNFTGDVFGKFEWSENHPQAKVLTNFAFIVSAIAGVGIALVANNGQRTITREKPRLNATVLAAGTTDLAVTVPAAIAAITAAQTGATAAELDLNTLGLTLTLSALFGIPADQFAYNALPLPATSYDIAALAASILPNILGGTENVQYQRSSYADIPNTIKVLNAIPSFANYLTQGTDETLNLIRAFTKYRNFALKYNSHGLYNQGFAVAAGNRRKEIAEQSYIGPEIVDFSSAYRINNLFRNKYVALNLSTTLNTQGFIDNTRQRVSDVAALYPGYSTKRPTDGSEFRTTTAAYYTALKQRIRNQYGQIDNISQVHTNNCYVPVRLGKAVPASGTIFGGDIYVGRYSEKTTFFYFYDWLYDQPDGYQFNYDNYKNILYPRYWLNMEEFQTNDFTSSLFSNVFNPSAWVTPSDYYNLDPQSAITGLNNLTFSVRNAYFYLFNSGVREFFVESEINIDLRDWGDTDAEKHYPILSDVKRLFDTSIIRAGNYYKYDQSLSFTKTLLNYFSWGTTQARSYSPYLAETCYTYTPNRVIYSLPAQFESEKDNWLYFLANNYYDFDNYVRSIKSINKSGAIIFFDTASPVQFQGLDQLETDLGTKLTIGDGGLFSQPMQSVINADSPYEYASCQDRLSVINTSAGLYWISQNQGKIFKIAGSIEEVSLDNLKWWFAQYLPYQLLQQNITNIQNFELTDNPVAGIGCQSIFDNQNQLLYFCKKDYVLKRDLPANISLTYLQDDQFTVSVGTPGSEGAPIGTATLGDPLYFEDASWTISYDPKTQGFISYHDWHPTLTLPGKNTFMSVNPNDKKSIWIHNERCDLYANYYGIDYPFEVEWMVNTGNQVNSLRSVEYQLEVYKYAPNCYDRFHKLDTNFDEAVVYNTEQCSGLLKLNLTPRNNAPLILNYPVINPTNIEILFSKVEQKYMFNQFWDITRDRGEFPIGSPYPPPTPNVGSYAQQTIWNTAPNGYVRILNPNNLDYNKNSLQRKKFRHYTTSILLRKLVSGDSKFLVMTSTNKNLYSPR